MAEVIEGTGQAGEPGTANPTQVAEGQAASAGTGTAGEGSASIPYTDEEFGKVSFEDIDRGRLTVEQQKLYDRLNPQFNTLKSDHTRKSQELAELKKTPPTPETYFNGDPQREQDFSYFLKDPSGAVTAINARLRQLRAVDSESSDYSSAQQWIAYYEDIKDQFPLKRTDIMESRMRQETETAKTKAELGEHAEAIEQYALELGYSATDFRTNPKIRQAVKKTYEISNAATIAARKEVKPTPQKTVTPSGQVAGGGGTPDEDAWADPNISTEDRIALWRKNKS